ncbi:MAG: hypothetical protein ACI957_003995 [Verrucomicrobiales bacterium]
MSQEPVRLVEAFDRINEIDRMDDVHFVSEILLALFVSLGVHSWFPF